MNVHQEFRLCLETNREDFGKFDKLKEFFGDREYKVL